MAEVQYITHIHCDSCGRDFGQPYGAGLANAKMHVTTCTAEKFPVVGGDTVWLLKRGEDPTVVKIGRVVRIESLEVIVERIDRGYRRCPVLKREFGFTLFTDQIRAAEALREYKESEEYRLASIKQSDLLDAHLAK